MPTQLFLFENDDDVTGTAGDDFIVALPAIDSEHDTLQGGDGDDYILGDSSSVFTTGTSTSSATPHSLETVSVWTLDENPFIADSTLTPHASIYIRADAGQTHFSSVTVGAAGTITIDIDFGRHFIGGFTDVVVELYDSSGVLLARNSGSSSDLGAAGSLSNSDPFLTFTNVSSVSQVYTIRFGEFPDAAVFEGGESFVANISVTGHAFTAPTVMGNDTLSGGNGDDTIGGQGGNDILNGDAGVDALFGGSGNDQLNGGTGADLMAGGSGDDIYTVDNDNDVVVEEFGLGTDRVNSSVSHVLTANIENLTLTGADAIDGIGNNLANALVGNSADNFLIGQGGSDSLNGGAGADTMNGGTSNDVYFVENAGDRVIEGLATGGIDTVISSITFVLGTNVEHLTLNGTAAVNAFGNAGNNFLTGNSGNNILSSAAGNDTLNGAGGIDHLYGGLGNDRLTGGTGPDRFIFNTALNAATNLDSILDFSVIDDTIALDQTIFSALPSSGTLAPTAFRAGTAAADADDRIIYDSATGRIYYDADGNGAGAQILFAQVNVGLILTNADFLMVP